MGIYIATARKIRAHKCLVLLFHSIDAFNLFAHSIDCLELANITTYAAQ